MPEFNTKKIEIVVYDVIEEKHTTYFRIEFKLNKDITIAILNKAIEELRKYGSLSS